MLENVYDVAILVAVWGAYARFAAVMFGLVRTIRNRARFVTFRLGWVEAACSLEPFLLAGVTFFLSGRDVGPHPALTQGLAAVGGAALVLAGWNFIIWTWLSWPTIFVGHGVLAGHQLITDGAYGRVRHPVYLGAILVWLGLALAFMSAVAFALTLLYVIPVYLLYMRSEEAMMQGAFGAEYERYRRAVPMLVPRFGTP